MATARDFISMAAKEAGILGVGQTLLSEDTNTCFTLMQRMMAQWQKRRWLVPMLMDISAVGDGSVSNKIGPGEHYDTPRPDKVQSAYFIQRNSGQNTVSYPLQPIFSYEDYSLVALKNLNSFPYAFFYDGSFPTGNVFIYPIPSSAYEIHLIVKGSLGFPTDLDQEFELPPEYEEAIHYNLALRICSAYALEPSRSTGGLAKVALNTIKNANAQVPTLYMPGYYNSGGNINLLAGGGSGNEPVQSPAPIIITTQTYTIDQTKSLYFVNCASPVQITMGISAGRNNLNCVIKDISGNASVNNISIYTVGIDNNGIDGQEPYVINTDFGGVNLQPSTNGYTVLP